MGATLLDDFVELIETLKTRIRDHGHTLRENETRTRMVLVDPLLCALGWDTRNPEFVMVEYQVEKRRADYALLGDGTPAAIVEAKRLGDALDQHLNQMLTYANAHGIPKAAITDGNHWHLYEVFKPVSLAERLILEVRVADERPVECAMKFLGLWRRNLLAKVVDNRVLPRKSDQRSWPHPPSKAKEERNKPRLEEPSEPKKGKQIPRQRLQYLYDRSSIADVAEALGLHPATARKRLEDAGIKIRGQGKKPPKA